MRRLECALHGNVAFQCLGCLMCLYKREHHRSHVKDDRCPANKADFRVDMHKIFGLTLDGKTYSCHLGCN